jgi:hypothetical protein
MTVCHLTSCRDPSATPGQQATLVNVHREIVDRWFVQATAEPDMGTVGAGPGDLDSGGTVPASLPPWRAVGGVLLSRRRATR